MSTFTSSLPDDLLEQLVNKAKELSVPKNTLISGTYIYFENIVKSVLNYQ
jgi:hypothetical protein